MNFSLSSALRGVLVGVLVGVLGCGSEDGSREYAQGLDAYGVRDLARAERLFAASLEAAPDDVDRLVSLARVKLDLGDLVAAQRLVTKAELLAAGDADVTLLAAQVAWHAKDYEQARRHFEALANDVSREPSVRAEGWAGLGVVELTCARDHFARIAFLRAIRLDRRAASAWYHLGFIYRDNFGYLEAALEQFEFFVRLEAEASPRVQKVQRTVIPELKEKIAQAAAEIPGVSRRDPSACATALAQAEAAKKKGLYRNARQLYQTALTADPQSYPAALGLAQAWEKSDTTKAGQAKALESYRRACQLRASSVRTFLAAGALAARLGLHAQAAEIYSRAVAASPASFDAIDGLIRALRKAGTKDTDEEANAYQRYRDALTAEKKK